MSCICFSKYGFKLCFWEGQEFFKHNQRRRFCFVFCNDLGVEIVGVFSSHDEDVLGFLSDFKFFDYFLELCQLRHIGKGGFGFVMTDH